MANIVEKIKTTYAKLDKTTVNNGLLEELYAPDILFIDPLHKIETLPNLKKYFEGMYKNVTDINFNFEETMSNEHSAFLSWTMVFSHPKLNGGQSISVPGTTRLQHNGEKITLHQDYFDSTHMIFDHIPVLKTVIKTIRNRLN